MPVAATDADLIEEFLRAVTGMTGPEVRSRVAGVTEHDISRWRAGGGKRLTEPKRQAIIRFLEWSSDAGEAEEGAEVFADLDNLVRRLGDVAAPGREKERKLAAVEAAERTRILLGLPFPRWWWDVRRRILEDEL